MSDINKIFKVKKESNNTFHAPHRQQMEEDYAVRKNINTKEGTIEKTPVNGNDIVNKDYADSISGGIEEAPNDGEQYARKNEAWAIVETGSGTGGTSNHSELDELDYESSGHTGFASTVALGSYTLTDDFLIHANGTGSDHTYINQDVTTTGSPTFGAGATGALDDINLYVGDPSDYGIIEVGNTILGRTSRVNANLDLDGTFILENKGNPATSNILFAMMDGTNSIRFALPQSGVGNATYNPRSMLIAGPAVNNDEIVKVDYWQDNEDIFHNLTCNTSATGADLGVQNNLEVEGIIYTNDILESGTGSDVTINGVAIGAAGSDITSNNAFRTTPSSVITAGDNISWTGNTLNVTGGSGDVSKVGTPANNQLGVWTGDGTIEGESELTYDGSRFDVKRNSTGTYNVISGYYVPDLGNSEWVEFIVGKEESDYNRFSLAYAHTSNGSSSNAFKIIFYGGQGGALTYDAGGNLDIPHNITVGGTVDGIDIATDVTANTSARHTQGTDTTLGSGCVAADHGTATTDQIVNVCYGTGSTPPTASTTTEGALYIQYTA